MARKQDRGYCNCGRRIVIYHVKARRIVVPQDSDHDLCQQCWKAEKDRQRTWNEMWAKPFCESETQETTGE